MGAQYRSRVQEHGHLIRLPRREYRCTLTGFEPFEPQVERSADTHLHQGLPAVSNLGRDHDDDEPILNSDRLRKLAHAHDPALARDGSALRNLKSQWALSLKLLWWGMNWRGRSVESCSSPSSRPTNNFPHDDRLYEARLLSPRSGCRSRRWLEADSGPAAPVRAPHTRSSRSLDAETPLRRRPLYTSALLRHHLTNACAPARYLGLPSVRRSGWTPWRRVARAEAAHSYALSGTPHSS